MNRTDATHEAGHAIGRLLTAELMGYEPAEAVDHIDATAAICFGPMVSADLERRFKERHGDTPFPDERALWSAIARAAAPRELRANMFARMLFVVMGPAAEAKLKRLNDAGPVFAQPSSGLDRRDFGTACMLLGLPGGAWENEASRFLEHAMSLYRRPHVWAAVNAVVRELRGTSDRMSGSSVAEIAMPHLSQDAQVFNALLPPGVVP